MPSKSVALKAAVGETFKVEIVPGMERQRLDRALTDLLQVSFPAMSRARVQALIAAGHVSLAGKPIDDASRKAQPGEVYTVYVPLPVAAVPEAQEIELNIVHEDKDVLVVDKPAGLVVHPAPGNRDMTLVNALLAHCKGSLSGIGGVARPGIVHRLDKDTSGLIVIAKNDVAHQALTRQFADRSLSRTYQAIVWGVPLNAGSVDAPIGRHTRDRKKMNVTAKGKQAVTHYTLLKNLGEASLIECKLETGRTHQIRVHLAHIKHPVVGDPVYGRRGGTGAATKDLRAFPRQALHAVGLQFVHPRSGKLVRFTSPLPADMTRLLKKLAKASK
jgi:23S rRNA pseudouridine1911/1915/1917 synthase